MQLFKGTLYHCEGPDVSDINNKTDCINKGPPYRWINRKYNFDNLGQVSSGALGQVSSGDLGQVSSGAMGQVSSGAKLS